VAHDFISDLPNGYETSVGVARNSPVWRSAAAHRSGPTVSSQAPILVLDEATSALDSETEQQVLQNLQKVSHNRTVFSDCPPFCPFERANLIVVLEKGVLVEKGTHNELLQSKGLYASLYQRQQASV
jgi:ATP-binding cassette subfamily B protein